MSQVTRLDRDGTIQLHGREGLEVTWTFKDEVGQPEDATALLLFFETNRGFRKALGPGALAHSRVLTLTEADVQAMFTSGQTSWVVRDETVSPPEVLWSGRMRFFGWQ